MKEEKNTELEEKAAKIFQSFLKHRDKGLQAVLPELESLVLRMSIEKHKREFAEAFKKIKPEPGPPIKIYTDITRPKNWKRAEDRQREK